MRRAFIAVALGWALGVATACALTTTSHPTTRDDRADFVRIDLDRNGAITWDEWRAFDPSADARRHFESLDLDRDARITPGEWSYHVHLLDLTLDLFPATVPSDDGGLSAAGVTGSGRMAQMLSIGFGPKGAE